MIRTDHSDYVFLINLYTKLESRLDELVEDIEGLINLKAEIEWQWENLAAKDKLKVLKKEGRCITTRGQKKIVSA